MTLSGIVRKVLGRTRGDAGSAARPDRARAVDEARQAEQARAWQRKGGPVDPGLSA